MEEGTKLWIWRNGDHYWVFDNEYPCETPNGDPLTIGEPMGFGIFKKSSERAK